MPGLPAGIEVDGIPGELMGIITRGVSGSSGVSGLESGISLPLDAESSCIGRVLF
jgi:hypothetical protein